MMIRLKILWFVIKTLFLPHGRSKTIGKEDHSYVIADEDGNFEYLRFTKGNNYE